MKQLVLAAAAILASGPGWTAPAVAAPGKVASPPVSAGVILYSQNGTDSGVGLVSQNFEATFDDYDARAADDFRAINDWTITEVDVKGTYLMG